MGTLLLSGFDRIEEMFMLKQSNIEKLSLSCETYGELSWQKRLVFAANPSSVYLDLFSGNIISESYKTDKGPL